jgi:hypothetical protein
MPAFPIRCGPRRHLAWLLSVALLLPIAQTAATWHALSLACVDRGDVYGKPLSHPSRCDFCLTVAGLSGGAATGTPPPSAHPVALHESPASILSRIVFALPAWDYRSRAPPFAPL